MIWSALIIVAEIVVAASLASTRPFLASFVVGVVIHTHAPDLPDPIEWMIGAPVLGVLLVLAGIEHFLKWRETSSILDAHELVRKVPGQLVAVVMALVLFEALRLAGPAHAVELIEAWFGIFGNQLASAVVHLILGVAVAALTAWLSSRHQSAQDWVARAGGGVSWIRNVEALLVVVASLAATLVFWTLAGVAVAALIAIGLVVASTIGTKAVEHGARIACATCGYRRARGAVVCPKCKSAVGGAVPT